jgi:hypothetical protein
MKIKFLFALTFVLVFSQVALGQDIPVWNGQSYMKGQEVCGYWKARESATCTIRIQADVKVPGGTKSVRWQYGKMLVEKGDETELCFAYKEWLSGPDKDDVKYVKLTFAQCFLTR